MGEFFKSAFDYISGSASAPGASVGYDPFVGQTVELEGVRMRVQNVIAQGGFGVVFAAKEEGSGNHLALKRLVTDRSHESYSEAKEEIRILKTLSKGDGHEFVLKMVACGCLESSEVGMAAGRQVFLLATERCYGGIIDLINGPTVSKSSPLPVDDLLRIFYQTCQAVRHMHEQNPPIIHRDLKIENLLVGKNRKVRLCDFGSCTTERYDSDAISNFSGQQRRVLECEYQRHTTPRYRPPEILDTYFNYPVDERIDIWSLGVVLYTLCYLVPPFEDEAKLQIINGKYTIPSSDVRYKNFQTLIKKMLQIDPKNRPSIIDVVEDISAIAETENASDLRGGLKITFPAFDQAQSDAGRSAAFSIQVRTEPAAPSAPEPVHQQGHSGGGLFGGALSGAGSLFKNIKGTVLATVQDVKSSHNTRHHLHDENEREETTPRRPPPPRNVSPPPRDESSPVPPVRSHRSTGPPRPPKPAPPKLHPEEKSAPPPPRPPKPTGKRLPAAPSIDYEDPNQNTHDLSEAKEEPVVDLLNLGSSQKADTAPPDMNAGVSSNVELLASSVNKNVNLLDGDFWDSMGGATGSNSNQVKIDSAPVILTPESEVPAQSKSGDLLMDFADLDLTKNYDKPNRNFNTPAFPTHTTVPGFVQPKSNTPIGAMNASKAPTLSPTTNNIASEKNNVKLDPLGDLGGFNLFPKSNNFKLQGSNSSTSLKDLSASQQSQSPSHNKSSSQTNINAPPAKPNYTGISATNFSPTNPKEAKEHLFDDILSSQGFASLASHRGPTSMAAMQKKDALESGNVDAVTLEIQEWLQGKENNIRGLLTSLHTLLWQDAAKRWKQPGMHELVSGNEVKKFYRKACLVIHPDKQVADSDEQKKGRQILVELNHAWEQFEASGQLNT